MTRTVRPRTSRWIASCTSFSLTWGGMGVRVGVGEGQRARRGAKQRKPDGAAATAQPNAARPAGP
jgi:hypothetical protein